MAVPVTLAGPGAWLDNGQIHAELSQVRTAREPLRRLFEARPVEGRRIIALGLNRYCSERDLFRHKPHDGRVELFAGHNRMLLAAQLQDARS